MAKGQAALEFMLLLTFMFFLFVSFFAVIQGKLADALEGKSRQALIDQATLVYNDIKTASVMEDGFQKIISLPKTINGLSYTAQVHGSSNTQIELVLKYEQEQNYDSSFTLPKNIQFTPTGKSNYLDLGVGTDICLKKDNGKLIIASGETQCSLFS